MTDATGTEKTRQFYDAEGWTEHDGETTDRTLFGVKEDGPIRVELYQVHLARVRSALSRAGAGLRLWALGSRHADVESGPKPRAEGLVP